MNSHSKQRGYVSLELVLVAGLILAVGFFSMLTFSTTGKDLMQNGLAKIEDFFGGGTGPLPTIIEYDENGYPESLNIQLSDVNSIDDFSV